MVYNNAANINVTGYVKANGSGSFSGVATIPIADGGTNATSMATTDGVVYFDGTRLVTTSAGTATQVLTSNGAGVAPTFQAASGGGGLTFVDVTGTTQAMAITTLYLADNAALVVFTLPATAAQGSIMQVQGYGAGGWQIAQNASQQILQNTEKTTAGTGGSVSSVSRYGGLTILAAVGGSSTIWVVTAYTGSFTWV